MNPFNFTTMTEYAGKNALILAGEEFPAYATFNQIKAAGGKVKTGVHGIRIFCGFRTKKDGTKDKQLPVYGTVFHISQCDLDEGFVTYLAAEQALGHVAKSELELNAALVAKVMQ